MTSARPSPIRKRGSIYILVMMSAMLVTFIGLGSLLAIRVQRRSGSVANDLTQARLHAQSAVELGLLFTKTDADWRTNRANGLWISNQPLGDGTFSLTGVDPQDGDLTNSIYEPLVLTGIGQRGIARHQTQVTLVADIKALEALNTCLHTAQTLTIAFGQRITAVGAPVSANGTIENNGTIDGDAETASTASMGMVTGTLTMMVDEKHAPDADLVSTYVSKATAVPFAATLANAVLGPGYNPWGPANSDGMYFIDTGGLNMTIQNLRVSGTLIVRTGAGTLTLDDAVCFSPYESDHPVLIVDGNAIVRYQSGTVTLSEASSGTNYNPLGASYAGVWDTDTTDEYPNEIQGLVHVTGSLTLQRTAQITGSVICEGSVSCQGSNTIVHDPTLYAIPPEGYTFVDAMKVSPGSWKQVVD